MRLAFLSVPAMMLMACGGSGHAEGESAQPQGKGTRDYALSGFDKVSLRGPDDVTIRVGPAASVRAEGDKAVLDQLEIAVVNGELGVRRKNESWSLKGEDGNATITVTMPAIAAASVMGSGDMKVDHVKSADFAASVTGSGDLDIGSVESNSVALAVMGPGDLTIDTGKAVKTGGSVTGSGSIEAPKLVTTDLDLSITGSGDVDLGVTGAASVSLIGSGSATLTGGGTCKVKKIGSGEVKCS